MICLRFNPEKCQIGEDIFIFYNVLVEFVSNYGCFKVTLNFGFWPAQIEDCPVKINLNGSEFVASHMFLSATA